MISALLKVPRDCLGFGACGNGFIFGKISIFDQNRRIYEGGKYNQPFLIDSSAFSNENTQNLTFVVHRSIKYLLIVEKQTMFRKLCKGKWTPENSILFTGRGYPPLIVRAVISALVNSLKKRGRDLEMYCFVDGDPHGIDIFLAYQQGTINAPESYNYALPNLMYIGLEWNDINAFKISKNRALEMNQEDRKKVKALCQYLERKKEFYFDKFEIKKDSVQYLTYKRIWNQLKMLSKVHKKMEIDVIDNLDGLYLPRKVAKMREYYGLTIQSASYVMDVDSK